MTQTAGFRLSAQQLSAWRRRDAAWCGVRGVVAMPHGATPGDVKAALQAIAARHEVLRTRIEPVAGVPLQFVDDLAALHWEERKAGAPAQPMTFDTWPHPAGAALAACWVWDEASRGQAATSVSDCSVWLSLDGLHGDARTLQLIAQELHDQLAGRRNDADVVQYADYAQWQHELGEAEPGAVAYWRARPPLPVGRLPLERPVAGAFSPRTLAFAAPPDTSEPAVFAAWALLLARHLDQPGLTLGVVDAGRSDEVADACGPYARVLPLVLGYDAAQTWQQWCETVAAVRADAISQAEGLGAVDLEMALQYRRAAAPEPAQLLAVEAAFRLRLDVQPLADGGGLQLGLSYDAGRFDAEAAQALVAQLSALLAALPPTSQPLGEVFLGSPHTGPMVVPGEPGRLDSVPLLHMLIERQARLGPDRPAVACADGRLDYDTLVRRADVLAARLVAAGAAPDRIVAVCLPRSVDLVVALLAVLKSGAAYLPLDPGYPPERLDYMQHDSGACCLVADARSAAIAAAGLPVVLIGAPAPAALPNVPPRPPHPDQLAYVIYTSGSTGRPKGVAITHRNACHSTLARHRWYERPVSAYLMLSSVAFDSSVAGIFWTLTQGGLLVLPEDDAHRDVAALARLVEHHRASHLLALPSLHAQLLDAEPARLATLTDVIVAGEACSATLVEAHHRVLPQAALYNEYGPTEASVWSLAHATRPGEDPVPIGRPIPFIEAWVLDTALQPLPPGVQGELYLGGPALARGYLGRPDLTADRFVPHPTAAGQRLYRTGDRVRLNAAGQAEFLGRTDQQVKIRGFRIELGEIEARLAEHAAVREAVAVVREDQPGDRRVVAYVIARPPAPAAETLRTHLLRSLPEHLLPSAYVFVDAFPMTPNGKLDRKALPAPERASRAAYVAPRDDIEQQIAAVWSELLELEPVGVHDNFFELGGHSLVATQVVTRLRRRFDVELPVRELFAAPTVAGLALAVKRQRGQPAAPGLAPIEPLAERDALPLSYAQQRLWFLAQLDPDDVSYHIAGVLKMAGRLDVEAWASAFAALQTRHEVLRSRMPTDTAGRPRLVVEPIARASLERIDLSGLGDDVPAEAALRAQAVAQRPFSLAQGPLLRAVLITLAPEHHHLVLVMHHIVSDGWSTERLLQDWCEFYRSRLEAGATAPTPLSIQYADYAAWQRRQLTEAALSRELAHWRDVLGDEAPLLALPTDRPRPQVLSGRGDRVTIALPGSLAARAKAHAQQRQASLFMLLEAAYAGLLARHAGQDDIRIGTPVAGRGRLELEPLVGLFVNTVVLRHRFTPLTPFDALLDATRERVLDAEQHQQLPFERLVEALAPERDLGHTPLFQAMFDLQTERYSALARLPGLQVELQAVDLPTSKFDLSLNCRDTGDTIECCFEYSTDLFDRSTIQRLAQHYQQLLDAALAEPQRPLADLPLLDAAAQALLTPRPTRDWPIGEGFAALFDSTARARAGELAVCDGHTSLRYAELAQRARGLATALQQAGAGPERPVAILLPRSVDYLVAIVATQFAGAPWLPLDMTLPQARLVQMLSLAAPPVLVAAEVCDVAPRLRTALARPPQWVSPQAVGEGAPRLWPAHPQQLAYLIFTSGSTGTPKAAMVPAGPMLNHLLGKIEQLDLGPSDRIAQTASPCFDISVWQFLTALLCGASVHIVPDSCTRDGAALLRHVNAEGLTVLESVPSLMRGMLDDPSSPAQLPTLRCLLPTGEALPPEVARQWFRHYPGVPLINAYGPAECADDVALWRLDGPPDTSLAHLPIGTPTGNLRLHVVNDALQLQPPGVIGELAIAGAGVGRGYLGAPALTAERFVPDPYGPPGSRLYRSGDLARQAPDAVLSFVGRRDHQLKIRGHRVEPAEIEARLLQHDEVRAAAVLLAGTPPRLVAYVAVDTRDGTAQGGDDPLRSVLAAQLPEYMVPAAIVRLPALPLNANGKLDRARLPAPDFSQASQPDLAPRNDTERTLARVWAEVLGLPSVGLRDNFFALGGDSILSIQLVSKAREAGLQISARAVFQHQTVEALAAVAEHAAPAMARSAPEGDVPLTPIQHSFFELCAPNPHHWNQSVLLTPAARLTAGQVDTALQALVAHHDGLRLRFRLEEQGWVQHYASGPAGAVLIARQLDHTDELDAHCDAVQASLDLEHGPLLRAALFDLPGGEQRLLIAVHHLVVDGVSWRILLDDLATALQPGPQGVVLPARTASYQDWARSLLQRAERGEFDTERPFWQAQQAPALPVERPGGSRLERDIEIVHVTLDRQATERLLQCGQQRATPDDFLLTALAQVLLPWSQREALLVEQESHGRPDDLDLGRTVGWFTAAYPLRLAPDLTSAPVDQLKQVKQALRSVPNGGIGYGALRYLQRVLPAANTQVAFNYLGQLDASADRRWFAKLDARSGRLYDGHTARRHEFDLNAYVLGGQLQLDWGYSRERYARATVESLAARFVTSLATLLQLANGDAAQLLTPQDFPEAALDAASFDQLLAGME
ncbi:non-ribosomal peptide synthetase [Caldimonas brevitalea]|uniref:Non-ribosomal peptide synthetase n=1 Tax=Caldimonas brevitalea TaxID=413882 RepID=A0A0G3BQ38_9BURK|nr:non-ribosomal peptide synthetase [Caldimonas brevitalea]AKJ29466.1 Non-ribosomal peptide synthetase [Caldimonas brevitalea]